MQSFYRVIAGIQKSCDDLKELCRETWKEQAFFTLYIDRPRKENEEKHSFLTGKNLECFMECYQK